MGFYFFNRLNRSCFVININKVQRFQEGEDTLGDLCQYQQISSIIKIKYFGKKKKKS